jgi:serine protease
MFRLLWLLGFLVACDSSVTLLPEETCQDGYACLHISIKSLPPIQPLTKLENATFETARVSDILSLANSDSATLHGFGLHEQGLLNLIHADQVWSYAQGEGVTVAVIDSGVDLHHEALATQVLPGYDFIEHRQEMHDPTGHGTAIAAIIAGQGTIKGFAPKSKILPLRVLDQNLQASAFDVTQAILYAADVLPDLSNPYPAQVINLSLGGTGEVPSIYEAIKLVRQKGVIVVAAVGNSGAAVAYPAAYPEVIAVGAAYVKMGQWQRERYSSYGPGLDILAPVGGVTKTNWGWFKESAVLTALANSADQTVHMSGTSVAAPQVAALAALLLSLQKTSQETEFLLQHASLDLSQSGWDAETGFGLMNPVAALRATTVSSGFPIQIQFLDQGSQQEREFIGGQRLQSVKIPAGSYSMLVWNDQNQDNVWQAGESCFWQNLDLEPGKGLNLELELVPNCPK